MYEADFCEFSVKKKIEGKYLLAVVAVAIFTLLFAACFFLVILPLAGGVVSLLVLSAAVLLLWYLSRFAEIEYEYSESSGYLDFAAIYSKQYRKEKLSVDLKKCAKRVMPYTGSFEGIKVCKVYDFRSSKKAENQYALVFEDGETRAVLFDGNYRLVNAIRLTVPSVTLLSDKLVKE